MGDQKIPMSEAADMLTLGEIGCIEKHFRKSFVSTKDDDFEGYDEGSLSALDQMSGVIWAMERRKPRPPESKPFSWADVEAFTMRQATDYFAPEPIELDDRDPETDSGKDDSLAG